jgi:calcineurin-like phosphoesterase family protein
MSVFFTSDTHFNHANIIKYCNRPFKDVDEMNEALIKKWNAKVGPNDLVYHLGDFGFGTPEQVLRIKKRLNGQIYLLRGNHEKSALAIANEFVWVKDVFELKVESQTYWLSHYAHRVWNKSHHGVYHLYGHSHGTLPDDPNSLSFDVGVDCHNFEPLTPAEVKRIMDKKTFKPLDHHGKE